MAKTHFHGKLEKEIATALIERSQSIVNGACGDYAAYRYQVGYLEGLNDALKIADAIAAEDE
jgi:hypothetical protein